MELYDAKTTMAVACVPHRDRARFMALAKYEVDDNVRSVFAAESVLSTFSPEQSLRWSYPQNKLESYDYQQWQHHRVQRTSDRDRSRTVCTDRLHQYESVCYLPVALISEQLARGKLT